MLLFGLPDKMNMSVIDILFSLKASLSCGRAVLCALFLCFSFLSLVFAENTIILVLENIFHSGRIV